MNDIRINGKVLSRTLADHAPSRWQAELQRAYTDKVKPECLCNGASKSLLMHITRRGDTYILKKGPNSGRLHHRDCDSHGGISQDASSLYTEGAISERDDGKVKINLSVNLSTVTKLADSTDDDAAPPRLHAPGKKRNTVTLRGFLNFIWEESGLNSWSPANMDRRGLGHVYDKLREELGDRIVGGDDAVERVYVPSARFGDDEDARKRIAIHSRFDRLDRICGTNKKGILLIVAEVLSIAESKYDFALRLKGFPDDIPVWTSRKSIDRLQRQWPHMFARFMRRRAVQSDAAMVTNQNRLFVICGVQRTDRGSLQWKFGAAMETTENFIPIDSQYEADIANNMVAQNCSFRKPLRYDGEEAAFPDFIMMRGHEEVPMEIYGFSSDQYNARKAEKIAMYRNSKLPFWQWDLSIRKSPPPLPNSVQA